MKNRLTMGDDILKQLYEVKTLNTKELDQSLTNGIITEQDKFKGAKQILFGMWALEVIILIIVGIRPELALTLIEICKNTIPPLVVIPLMHYFK